MPRQRAGIVVLVLAIATLALLALPTGQALAVAITAAVGGWLIDA